MILVSSTCSIYLLGFQRCFFYNQICEALFSVHVDWGEQFRRDTCKVVDEINLDRLIFQKASMKIFDEQLYGCKPDEVTEDENGFCSC